METTLDNTATWEDQQLMQDLLKRSRMHSTGSIAATAPS